uniref:Peptidase S1 domain-containing protein n=2 Tax=Photinus pyralis TaxID=7054 RepID=A0A1Y1LYM2_PHOPY
MTNVDCLNHEEYGNKCSEPVKDYSIEEVKVHEGYIHSAAAPKDIALVRLSRDVEYSDFIRPVCLPTAKEVDLNLGVELTSSGWGTGFTEKPPVVIKKKFTVWLRPVDECNKLKIIQTSHRRVTDDHHCVGSKSAILLNATARAEVR